MTIDNRVKYTLQSRLLGKRFRYNEAFKWFETRLSNGAGIEQWRIDSEGCPERRNVNRSPVWEHPNAITMPDPAALAAEFRAFLAPPVVAADPITLAIRPGVDRDDALAFVADFVARSGGVLSIM